MYQMLKSTGGGYFGTKFGEEVIDWCKPNFNKIWKRHWAVVSKRNRVDIFKMWSQCMNMTDRQSQST